MPPLPFVSNVSKVVVNFTVAGIPCANVFHIRTSATPVDPADMNKLAQNVFTQWTQNFIPLMTNEVTALTAVSTDLTSAYGVTGSYGVTSTGSAAGTMLSAADSIVGSWVISKHYRGGKPRTYMCGLPTTARQNALNWTATVVTSWTNGFTAFRNNINSMATPTALLPVTLGTVHYFKGHALLPTPEFEGFGGVVVRSAIRSQRRRLT